MIQAGSKIRITSGWIDLPNGIYTVLSVRPCANTCPVKGEPCPGFVSIRTPEEKWCFLINGKYGAEEVGTWHPPGVNIHEVI